MDYAAYLSRFLDHRRIADVTAVARLREGDKEYPLLRAVTAGARTLLITAGFHGDETAGPLTLLERLPEVVDYARQRDVGLCIYPCLNPSGFEDGTRYNRSGEHPNNDFLRYEITPGAWVGELLRGQREYVSHALFRGGPKETQALRAELEAMPTPAAALDIHQDPWMPGEVAYAYTFGPRDPYRAMIAACARLVSIARSTEVDDDDGVWTDEDGLIEFHDGSITDYLYRRGVPYAAALETTTATPMQTCHQVNLIWIRGFIDLAASS